MRLTIVQQAVCVGDVQVVLTRSPDFADPAKPTALMLHGALGAATVLLGAAAVFAQRFEPILVDLPGHGRSTPLPVPDVPSFARVIAGLIDQSFADRPPVLVGESFGGLVALAAARLRPAPRVVMIDSPLSTAKQWHVGQAFQQAMAARPDDRFIEAFGWAAFGVRRGAALIEERLYYPLFDGLSVPTTIITGDTPLGHPRSCERVPCCLDAVDVHVVERITGGRTPVVRVPGAGHTVLRERPDACLAIVARG